MVTYYHTEDEQRSRLLKLPDNADKAIENQTASFSHPAKQNLSKLRRSRTSHLKLRTRFEVPDSEAESDKEISSSEASSRTVDTKIIPGGTKLAGLEDMDGPATQPTATQPFADPRRHGNNSLISEEDECDVLCILRPTNPSAYHCVRLVAKTAPEHILQNHEANFHGDPRISDDEETTSNSLLGIQPEDGLDAQTLDIALRMSAKLKNPVSGFIFGRTPNKCDVLLVDQEVLIISGSHFRIYLNEVGVLMLEDTSRNGLFVDDVLLRANPDKPESKLVKRRMIANGSVIRISLDYNKIDEKMICFIVTIPPRHRAGDRYRQKVADYMAYLQQLERQADVQAQRGIKSAKENLPRQIPLNPLGKVPPESGFAKPLATMSHYSAEWNGGEKYNMVGKIGQGAFATVYQLATKKEGELFAVKEIEKRRFMKNGRLDSKVMNEIFIMKTLDHPNIVKFIDHEETTLYLYIIMEFVPCGDLLIYIDSGNVMAEYMCQSIAQQICSAIEYMHREGVTHRDIKPDNILVETRDPIVVKLSDFGLSKRVENGEELLKTFCGTLLYCAPEVYPDYGDYIKRGVLRKRSQRNNPPARTTPYKPSVDIWALGAVLYHLLCNKPPWEGSLEYQGQNMLRNVMQNPIDQKRLKNAGVSDIGVDFVVRMLHLHPNQRPTELECLEHEWIANRADGKALDQEMKDLDKPLDAIEEDLKLAASQLSIVDNTQQTGIEDSDEDWETEDERQSKRIKSHHQPNAETSDESSEDDMIPQFTHPGYKGSAMDQAQVANTNRLFGEIGASALRNSGILNSDAHSALDIPFDTRFVTATCLGLPPHSLPNPQSASSILGAEALVGQLNMASLTTGTSTSESLLAKTEEPNSRANSPKSVSGLAGSKHSSHAFHESDTSTAKRAKKGRLHDVSHHSHHLEDPLTRSDGSQTQEGPHEDEHKSANKAGKMASSNMGVNDPQVSSEVITSSSLKPTGHALTEARSSQDPTSTPASAVNEITNTNFIRPPTRLGVLTSIPGSICSTTIKLERRLTFYGRDPESHVIYADLKDTRVPRNALDIIFWRPGIEAQIASGQNWMEFEDLYAIIHTRTRRHIKVNGTKLTRGTGCWEFGRLHTGDVITVFGPEDESEGQAAEFLKFRCDFFMGASAKVRDANTPFVVEREEEKYILSQAKRSNSESQSTLTSQGSEGSTHSATHTHTTAAK